MVEPHELKDKTAAPAAAKAEESRAAFERSRDLEQQLWDWSIVVFARNEQARVSDCLTAIADATMGVRAHLTLIVNGSSDDTLANGLDALRRLAVPSAVYTIPLACKSNAMNVFVHEIRPHSQVYMFVDATAFVERGALVALGRGLDEKPGVTAVSGLPRNGRGASRMRNDAMRSDRLFGQMFAVRGDFLDQLVQLGRRLPIGLYRCDGLFAGYICYETDGVAHAEPQQRVANISSAGWCIRPLSKFDVQDFKAGYNRLVRQARGRLENQAWNAILWTEGFGALPRFADEMILTWLKTNRPTKEAFPNRLFTWRALRRIRRWRRPSEADLLPTRVF